MPRTAEKRLLKIALCTVTCVGALLCEECGTTGLCSTCAELWESEIDLEAMEAAAKHPKAQFRLTLNSTYDPSGPKRTALFFSRMMKAVEDMHKNPNKAVNTAWEIYKKYP